MDQEMKELLERGINAIEQLAADPVINVESGPPICPFCERINPTISTRESEASGPLGMYVVQARCKACNEVFYGMPQMWLVVKTIEEVREEIDHRRATYGDQ